MNSQHTLVHLLAVLFGVSAWIAINGLWQQTPILVNRLPESWNLASYITLITQLANVGPVVYSLLKRYFPSKRLERFSIHTIDWIGIVALILLIFFWDKISIVNGREHSVAFLLLTFFLAIVDCTSSVLYIPYMSSISSTFLVSHLVGQSLSGLIPSFLALAQGVGGNPNCVNINGTIHPEYPEPRFSVNVFFLLLTFLAFISWIAFVCLQNLKRVFKIDVSSDAIYDDTSDQNLHLVNRISGKAILALLITEATICSMTNGILPPIQPYSVLVYGNVSHHFVVTLSAIASATGTYLSLFLNRRQAVVLTVSLTIAIFSSIYIIASALTSPHQLIANGFGSFFIVFVWITNNLMFSFARATITRLLRSQKESHKYLFLGGVFTQIGSFVGAIVMFCIINYTDSFVSYIPCQ